VISLPKLDLCLIFVTFRAFSALADPVEHLIVPNTFRKRRMPDFGLRMPLQALPVLFDPILPTPDHQVTLQKVIRLINRLFRRFSRPHRFDPSDGLVDRAEIARLLVFDLVYLAPLKNAIGDWMFSVPIPWCDYECLCGSDLKG
jgi:hypothetical protein